MITLEKILKIHGREVIYKASAPTIDQAIESLSRLTPIPAFFRDVPAEPVTTQHESIQHNGTLKQ